MAACTCGVGYSPSSRRQVWESWEKEKMREKHRSHIESL